MKWISTTLVLGAASATNVVLATFDGAPATTFRFSELNDPVMGGRSVGTWTVDKQGKFGIFDGEVKDVPSLKAPGFIATAADGAFADAHLAIDGDLVLSIRTTTSDYKGFRFSLASGSINPDFSCAGGGQSTLSRGCFKTKFSIPAGTDFTDVRIPFSSFSDVWSPATGEQIKTCANDTSVCITADALKTIQRLEIWGEGVLGKLHVEVQSIRAESSVIRALPTGGFNTCGKPVQSKLLYGISGRKEATVPVPVDDGETLAEAVCCDSRTAAFAEPQGTFSEPDVDLFAKIPHDGTPTIFFDSTCGLPLFKAPINRTFEDFRDDTKEHGWPSFRVGEIYLENVLINQTTLAMTSTCGTHLGTYLPDEKGERYCIDLSCVSGNPL